MQKNHKLAKAISGVSWSKFREYLDYKEKWKGRDLIIAQKTMPVVNYVLNVATKIKTLKTLICLNGLTLSVIAITIEA